MWIHKGAALIRGRGLFEARRLLEEIWYVLFFANPELLVSEHFFRIFIHFHPLVKYKKLTYVHVSF